MEARDTLIAFLHEQKSAGQSVVEEDSVEALVESNFDLIDDGVTRKLIDRALAERDTRLAQKGSDSELLGSWGVIIDAIKEVTLVRRDRAGELLQLIVSTGMQKGPKELEALVYALRDKGQVDRLLIDLVSTSAQQCKQQGNALADILLYCQAFLEKTKDLKSARVTSPPTLAKAGAGSGSTASSPAPASTSAPASTPASSSASASASTPASSSASVASEDEEEEEEEEEEDEEEQAKVAAGTLLRELLKDAAGDASALRMKLQQYVLTGEIGAPFVSVLEDNVAACRAAQYVNKLKVLEFMLATVQQMTPAPRVSSTHHAPKFVDVLGKRGRDEGGGEGWDNEHIQVTLLPTEQALSEFQDVREGSQALRLSSLASATVGPAPKINPKKKTSRQAMRKAAGRMAGEAAKHLEAHGWAVLDNFLPPEVVKRVRVETGLFRESFEQSEIWVGKQADVGAQIQVPSVRGDKVLWMCGGHSSAAPEGVSRTVRTIGEIEPCKMEVKAHAPIRRFAALKELVGTCDALMHELKQVAPSLAGVYERSDAMIAVYPGEGARFAKHIDNTTGDGRRLTVLVYLNPDWQREDGGALRLFPPLGKFSATDAAAAKHTTGTGASPTVNPLAVDVFPEGGRLAMFYSADIAHEVLPTFGQRHALTLWYYDEQERLGAVKTAAEGGSASRVAGASVEMQQAAKVFIAELMGGDEVAEDGGDPTQAELSDLAAKVGLLGDEVLGIVAAITGAPSNDSFRAGFPMLSVADLKQMRALFRRMGLGSYSV